MKINYYSFLALTVILGFTACKKNQEDGPVENPKLQLTNQTSNVPGQGNSEVYIQHQADGTYLAGWGSTTIRFQQILHKTSAFYDGEQVVDMLIINENHQYTSVYTIGPYFILVLPTIVGSVGPTHEEIQALQTAYNNFIEHKLDNNGTLLQSKMPNLEDYVKVEDNGQIIVTGQVVLSHASPSTLSVVPSTFVAPAQPAPMLTLLPEYIKNGIRYDLAGNDNNQITEVTAVNMATNAPVIVYGFSGNYTNGNPSTVQNLKIYTSPTDFFEYSGPLAY